MLKSFGGPDGNLFLSGGSIGRVFPYQYQSPGVFGSGCRSGCNASDLRFSVKVFGMRGSFRLKNINHFCIADIAGLFRGFDIA